MFEVFEHSNFGLVDLTETPGLQRRLGSQQQSWWLIVIDECPSRFKKHHVWGTIFGR